jgi:hypothetical protein
MLCRLKASAIAGFEAISIVRDDNADRRKTPQKATSSAIAKKLLKFSIWYIFFLKWRDISIDGTRRFSGPDRRKSN